MELFLTILLFVTVILLAAVVFAGWMVVMVLRAGVNAVIAAGRWVVGAPARGGVIRVRPARQVHCANAKCQALNPPAARFCRRCGQAMPKVIPVIARRAALF